MIVCGAAGNQTKKVAATYFWNIDSSCYSILDLSIF